MSYLSNKTAWDCAWEYRNAGFYKDGGIVFCTVCTRSVNHQRESTIDDHIMSNRHRINAEKVKRRQEETHQGGSIPLYGCSCLRTGNARLRTLGSVVTARKARIDIVMEFLKALIADNIPLENVGDPKIRNLLEPRLTNPGSIPRPKALRHRMPKLFEKHDARLKSVVRGSTVSMVVK
ncbi:CGG triplet repeat-binding protein 1-like [Ornithodoros turicata]|uniref:CGG triplet repeat-binding protein 1-like n=1 Tax=Ornithodoros turicata TaxID=34597 RepID=UPI003138C2D3